MRTGGADSITLLPQLPNIANVARRGTTQPCLRDHPQNCGAHDQAEHSPHGANSTVPANFPSAHFWVLGQFDLREWNTSALIWDTRTRHGSYPLRPDVGPDMARAPVAARLARMGEPGGVWFHHIADRCLKT